MLSDPARIADAINNPRFRAGDHVILAQGPRKFVHGTFLALKEDVEWAAIQVSNGEINGLAIGSVEERTQVDMQTSTGVLQIRPGRSRIRTTSSPHWEHA